MDKIIKYFRLSSEEYNTCELRLHQVNILETLMDNVLLSYSETELKQLLSASLTELNNRSLRDYLLAGFYELVVNSLHNGSVLLLKN